MNVVVVEQAILDVIQILSCQVVDYPESFADDINFVLSLILVRNGLLADRGLEDGDQLLKCVRVSEQHLVGLVVLLEVSLRRNVANTAQSLQQEVLS